MYRNHVSTLYCTPIENIPNCDKCHIMFMVTGVKLIYLVKSTPIELSTCCRIEIAHRRLCGSKQRVVKVVVNGLEFSRQIGPIARRVHY